FNHSEYEAVTSAMNGEGAMTEVVAKAGGKVTSDDRQTVKVDKMFVTTGSIMYDAVYVPGGRQSAAALKAQGDAVHFINEAFRHCKAIAASSDGVDLLR